MLAEGVHRVDVPGAIATSRGCHSASRLLFFQFIHDVPLALFSVLRMVGAASSPGLASLFGAEGFIPWGPRRAGDTDEHALHS